MAACIAFFGNTTTSHSFQKRFENLLQATNMAAKAVSSAHLVEAKAQKCKSLWT